MKGYIDRFEGDYAVVETEDMQIVNILRKNITPSAREGDYIYDDNGFFDVDHDRTNNQKEKIKKLMDQAFE